MDHRKRHDQFQRFPEHDPGSRKRLINNDVCPECGGELDTGFECSFCAFDAIEDAYTELDRQREGPRS